MASTSKTHAWPAQAAVYLAMLNAANRWIVTSRRPGGILSVMQ